MFAFIIQCIMAAAYVAMPPCECSPSGYPSQELKESAAVFLGRVSAIRYTDSTLLKEEIISSSDRIIVSFDVLKTWKGDKKTTLNVETGVTTKTCGYPFKVGESYLVYTFYQIGGSDSTTLLTSLCSRTRPLAAAAEDIEELDTPPRVQLKNK
jgi:hypothetical protein